MRRATNNDTEEVCLVKIAKTGSEVKEYSLTGDHTVEAALDMANIAHNGETRVRVNGEVAQMNDELEDGDIVTVSGNIKGGSLN